MPKVTIQSPLGQEPVFSLLGLFWSPQGAEVRFEQQSGVTLVLQEGMERVGIIGEGHLPHAIGKIESLMRQMLEVLREERQAYKGAVPVFDPHEGKTDG